MRIVSRRTRSLPISRRRSRTRGSLSSILTDAAASEFARRVVDVYYLGPTIVRRSEPLVEIDASIDQLRWSDQRNSEPRRLLEPDALVLAAHRVQEQRDERDVEQEADDRE